MILIDPVNPTKSIIKVVNYKYDIGNKEGRKKLEGFYDTLVRQDITASENQQLVLKQRWKDDILSYKEIRINKFREIYKGALSKSFDL